jgi:chromosome segregation ATPase
MPYDDELENYMIELESSLEAYKRLLEIANEEIQVLHSRLAEMYRRNAILDEKLSHYYL